MARTNKRKFDGESFILMAIRSKKGEAQNWAASARKHPHNARARVVKGKGEWLVYVHGERKRR
jgi:hypothetical protein